MTAIIPRLLEPGRRYPAQSSGFVHPQSPIGGTDRKKSVARRVVKFRRAGHGDGGRQKIDHGSERERAVKTQKAKPNRGARLLTPKNTGAPPTMP
jgi:hypothetical protein